MSGKQRFLFCTLTKTVTFAIKDGAFAAENLRTVRDVFNPRNTKANRCMSLRWASEWLKRPVFRKCNASGLSLTKPLPYHKLKDDMARQSLDYECEKNLGPKDPKWVAFSNAYINEKVEFHLQNAFCDEPTEDAVIAMLMHINVMRDPRATSDTVPEEIWD
ncbi:hypothetical protein SAMD00023353_1101300 [Rosellinia necatrix]|uniref:Uncharacterized protein n=1 Tax=Rosellinia necatrix TaxID=77044 RepID=A0A1S7UML6_ROSNE|nr:hypothetical protein SAMD00023353_1101300 [Rosellinia necatrix]